MRLTPAQGAIRQICGETLPRHPEQPLESRLKDGHGMLVAITVKDFGYDLQAWHDHLKVSRQGGYTYGRNILLPKIMQRALNSTEWQEAVLKIEKRQLAKLEV